MTTLSRLFGLKSRLLPIFTPLRRPSHDIFVQTRLRSFSSFPTMSENVEINATAEKRRGDSPSVDLPAFEPKRARLDEEPIASSSALGDSNTAAENAPQGEASMDVDTDKAGETTKKQESKSKRPDRRNQPKDKNRGRGGRRTRNEEDAAKEVRLTPEGDPIPKAPRYPKRQCSLLIGFCGSGYSGMQIQPDHTRTIEGVLFNALVKVGAVSQDNADNPLKAARTDAGVHAAGNIVSLKMIVTIPGVKDLVARINEELPPEIRLWGYGRTQNSFNARLSCDSRKYTYFFPTYLLIPPKPGSGLHRVWAEHAAKFPDALSKSPVSYDFWEGKESGSQEEDMARKRAWRINTEQVETLRTLAKKYEGTHNFHNFTVSRDFADRSNNRFMKKIEVADPVVYGDTEWISVLFHGQSFMLHQRKMMAILKITAINAKLKPEDPEYRPLIDFDVHREKMNAFKEVFIYKNMREVEDRDGLFDAWVRMIDAYAGNDLLYLNPTGAVPEAAVIKQGEKRANPFREKRIFDTTSFPAEGIKKKLQEEVVESDEEEVVLDKRQLEEAEG
ncbi:pseudouridine synthase [Pholiota molesta]|nr:pseudouridine synthase [Pholiota molesta]